MDPEGDGKDKDEPVSEDDPDYNCHPSYLPAIIIQQQPTSFRYGYGSDYGRSRNRLTREDRTQTTKPVSLKPTRPPPQQQTHHPNNTVANRNEEDGVSLDQVNQNLNAQDRILARSISTPSNAPFGQRRRPISRKITKEDLCRGYGGFFIMTQEVNPTQRDRGCQVITSATSGDIDGDNIFNVLRTIVKCLGYNRTIRVGSYFGDASEYIALNVSQGTNHPVEHYLYTKDYLPLLCYLDPKSKIRSRYRYSSSSSSSSSSS